MTRSLVMVVACCLLVGPASANPGDCYTWNEAQNHRPAAASLTPGVRLDHAE